MNDLDDFGLIQKFDPTDFLGAVERFPLQVQDAYERAQAVDNLPSGSSINSIAILGMGGSGISGDACRAILGPEFPLPVTTVKGYDLPGWVGADTLVFAVSYSGNTEETLRTFEEAGAKRGSQIVIVTTGGDLAKWGREFDLPIVEIPTGFPPRAAFGYLTIPIPVVLEKIGVGPSITSDVQEAVRQLDLRSQQWAHDAPTGSNPAKQLARRLFGKIPIIYGSEGLTEVAAYRWKCQLNECSKVPSWSHTFPELNHNEVVGWAELAELTSASFALIALRQPGDHERIAKRIDITLPSIQDNVAFVEKVHAGGESKLARLLDLTYLGDFVSTYLAIAQGVDPSTHDVITLLKEKLKEGD
jgi:glucose/mannose-6-phosphate isomerase